MRDADPIPAIGRRRWALPWRRRDPLPVAPMPGDEPPVSVTDLLWTLDEHGRLTGLSSSLGIALPVPWWRVVALGRDDRNALAASLRSGRPFRGLRARLRRGPLAGSVLELTGRRRDGGWSGAALVPELGWDGAFAVGNRRGGALVQAVLDQAAAALAADYVFVARPERDGTLMPDFAAATGRESIIGLPYRRVGTTCGDVLATGRPLVVADHLEASYPLFGRFRRLGIAAYAGAPVFEGAATPGAVLVALKTTAFDDPRRAEAVLSAAAERIGPDLGPARVEQQLSGNVARLSSLLDNLPGMAYRVRMSTDGRRRMLYASQGAARLIGLSPAEICRWSSERLLELRHPDDRERSLAVTLDRISRGEIVRVEWRLVRPDGQVLWVQACERLVERDGADLIVEGLVSDFTAEVETREALRRSVGELKAVADYTSDWESWVDGDAPPRWISPGVEKVTGYTAEECRLLPGYPRALVCDEDLAVFDSALAAARGGTAVADLDIRIRRRWGEALWCSLSIQPVTADGMPAGLRLCLRRIDRRKAAELMLQQREEEIARILAALDLVREAVVVSDARGLVSYANAAAARLLGFDVAASLCGCPWRELGLAGSSSAPFLDIIESSLASRGAWSGELALGRGAEAKFLDTRFARLPQDGFIAVLTDIGARKLADEQLRENQERYRALFETAGDAIFLMEGAGIIDCNPRAEAIFGYGRDALEGQGLHDFAPPLQPDGRESQAAAAALLSKALSGKPQAYEWLGRHRDGSLVNLDVTLTCVPRRGRPYLVAVARDITERRRREEGQRRLEQQLQQARKLEALGQLAGGVAHDFNNILGAIRGFADLLADEFPAGSQGERYVRRILTASDRAKGVIRQILTFTRRTEVSRRGLDLARLAEECVGLLRASIPATTGISFLDGAGTVVVDGDRDQLSQVILNLVINANDALEGAPGEIGVTLAPTQDSAQLRHLAGRTRPELALAVELLPDGQGGLTAVTGSFEPGRPHTTLSIADSGPGIPPEVMERAFDPFFTTKAAGHGTGLGLAVVHSIVLAHHGAIVLHSRPGAGCRFDIVMPCGAGQVSGETAAEEAASGLPSGTRVLVVDDDVDFGDMILAVLENRGIEAAVVSSPLDALEVLRQEPGAWDIMVTDLTMPEMRGIDLVKAVKAIRPDLPCLICTGNPEALDDAALAAAGAFALIHKPVDFPHYFALLGKALAAG